MIRTCGLLAGWLAGASALFGQTGFPFAGEDLKYTVNWPSGLSLGEAHMRAVRGSDKSWQFEFALEAAIPGFSVSDSHRASATSSLCSVELAKDATRGKRKWRETVSFDSGKGVAVRATPGGGKSEFPISACAKDALTFLYFTRLELGQGRVPKAETIVFGAAYQARLEYTGPTTLRVSDRSAVADRLVVSLKGPKSDLTFEMLFARDAARTPLAVRVPFALGTFSLELAQ